MSKINISLNGVKYSISSDKLSGALESLQTALSALAKPEYSEGLSFSSNGDGTCVVFSLGSCTDTCLVIPPTSPEGDKVVEIGEGAFNMYPSLSSVVIPDGVTTIGGAAFYECTSLTSVTIPSSVTNIVWQAFGG